MIKDLFIFSIILLLLDSIYLKNISNEFGKMITKIQGSKIDFKLGPTIIVYISLILVWYVFIYQELKKHTLKQNVKSIEEHTLKQSKPIKQKNVPFKIKYDNPIQKYKDTVVKVRTNIGYNKKIKNIDIHLAKEKLLKKKIIQSPDIPDDIVKIMYMLIFNDI